MIVTMQKMNKSDKLRDVCYDIRGPVLREATRLEDEGHRVLKLNIGNPAAFDMLTPDEILQDVIRNLPEAQGYCDSKGLYSARKAIMQDFQLRGRRPRSKFSPLLGPQGQIFTLKHPQYTDFPYSYAPMSPAVAQPPASQQSSRTCNHDRHMDAHTARRTARTLPTPPVPQQRLARSKLIRCALGPRVQTCAMC